MSSLSQALFIARFYQCIVGDKKIFMPKTDVCIYWEEIIRLLWHYNLTFLSFDAINIVEKSFYIKWLWYSKHLATIWGSKHVSQFTNINSFDVHSRMFDFLAMHVIWMNHLQCCSGRYIAVYPLHFFSNLHISSALLNTLRILSTYTKLWVRVF